MISLSRIIKSSRAKIELNDKRELDIKSFYDNSQTEIIEEEETEVTLSKEEIASIYEKANEEASLIIEKAKQEAEQIRMAIEQEKHQWLEIERVKLEEDAKEIGYNDGYTFGEQQGYSEIKNDIEQVKQLVDLAKDDYLAYIESAEQTILQLAMQVSEKIIGHELSSSKESFLYIVKKVLKEVREYPEIQLRVHHKNYPFLLTAKEELMSIFPKETTFYIYPDEDLQETACIIETSKGRIDASVDSQLHELKQKLIELLEGE